MLISRLPSSHRITAEILSQRFEGELSLYYYVFTNPVRVIYAMAMVTVCVGSVNAMDSSKMIQKSSSREISVKLPPRVTS